MKKFIFPIIASFLLFSCEKENLPSEQQSLTKTTFDTEESIPYSTAIRIVIGIAPQSSNKYNVKLTYEPGHKNYFTKYQKEKYPLYVETEFIEVRDQTLIYDNANIPGYTGNPFSPNPLFLHLTLSGITNTNYDLDVFRKYYTLRSIKVYNTNNVFLGEVFPIVNIDLADIPNYVQDQTLSLVSSIQDNNIADIYAWEIDDNLIYNRTNVDRTWTTLSSGGWAHTEYSPITNIKIDLF